MSHSALQTMGMEIVRNECDADGALSDGMMGAQSLISQGEVPELLLMLWPMWWPTHAVP